MKFKRNLFKTYLKNLAYHGGVLMTESGKVRISCCFGLLPGDEWPTYEIVQKGEHPNVWDQCYYVPAKGEKVHLGNRCGCRQHYERLAAEALARLVEDALDDDDDDSEAEATKEEAFGGVA